MIAWDKLNFMKAGIRHADHLTTVSRTYAREILTPAFGCGLDGLLRERAADLMAIPNGIDTALWDPARDPQLGPLRYHAGDLANKRLCKTVLQREFDLLPDAQATLVVLGSRLTEQKMADVAAEALPRVLDAHADMQVAILGQGDRRLENALASLATRYPKRCATRIGYNETGAHRLHAGATSCCMAAASSRSDSPRFTPCATAPCPSGRASAAWPTPLKTRAPTRRLPPWRSPMACCSMGTARTPWRTRCPARCTCAGTRRCGGRCNATA